ncbi:MAG TPA: hypothetical protein VMT45_10975 [Thermoanaerobaculaceae bacterium]|nr:hypothetical protein [Thermoanaerobaculaceae bacterium]
MRKTVHQLNTGLLVGVVVCGLLGLAATAAMAANVDVKVAVTGTPAFGATVTAKATVTINDASTLQSFLWKQTGGAAAVLSGTTTDTVTAVLAGRGAYRAELITVLAEPPLTAAQLPPNVPVPPGEFPGGLQDRFGVVGVNPFALEEGGAVTLTVDVKTSSGTYKGTATIATPLPFTTSIGTRNVPVAIPVIVHGKTQASYNWAMTVPTGSTAKLVDPTTQSPEFTPDVPGTYTLTVTDLGASAPVTIPVIAGLWRGVIVGQDAHSRPTVDTACTGCHAAGTALDLFTPWAQTGHAEIFTQNVNTPNGHYGTSCLSCHTVGYDTTATNNGIDDQPDWAAFLATNLLTHGDPTNWTNILAQFPKTAKLANIQCENCHGPQQSDAHTKADARETLSSDLCGSCHGEPARHGRYQQWQLSGHANYETAVGEGMTASCTVCHTANGFLAWGKTGYTASSVQVTWTADEIHPQTCQTCHDPHGIGTTSGSAASNATVRISGDTPPLQAGFTAVGVGRGAICMTCHNGRRGLRNDSTFKVSSAAQAPHVGPQADVLMGQNFYLVDVGTPGYHARVQETCVTCHMAATPPPDIISYNKGGTNHTFYASKDICSQCHATITADDVQGPVEEKLVTLTAAMGQALTDLLKAQITAGNKIDLGGLKTLTSTGDFTTVTFEESHGAQGMAVTLADASVVGPVAMTAVKVVPPTGSPVVLYNVADPAIPKSGWNLLMVESDASKGVHNPGLVKTVLDVSIYALQHLTTTTGGYTDPGLAGGPGNGAGAVSCTTPYVYWAEIATRGKGLTSSQWRTDMVAMNLAASTASLKFILHTGSGNLQTNGSVPALGQGIFADIVGMLGVDTKGSLEICSDKPLLVTGRIFNQATEGTFGQFVDGHVANLGLTAGQSAQLIGLRQETGKYRTNIGVANGGTQPAQAEITLFNNAGTALTTYTLTVPAGQVVQDLQPFQARANAPDLGWGFATVRVVSGSNVMTSASVVDAVTNDPTYVPAKR